MLGKLKNPKIEKKRMQYYTRNEIICNIKVY